MKIDAILKLADFYEKMAATKKERVRFDYQEWCRQNNLDYWREDEAAEEKADEKARAVEETGSKPKPGYRSNIPAITRTLYKPDEESDLEEELSKMEKAIYNV